MNYFSDECRRNPFPLNEQMRRQSPLFREPQSRLLMILDYGGVKRVLSDHGTFSSRHGPADWLIFTDPPRHAALRALISKAFTPRSVANLEIRIRGLSRQLLEPLLPRGEMDLAADYAIPLPMLVISEMLGIPVADRPRFQRWNDAILNMSYAVAGSPEAAGAITEFVAITGEMDAYLSDLLQRRRNDPTDDLLTRLMTAEVDGQRLAQRDILGFFQLLLLAGSETTTNLINNAILCFIDHTEQLERLRREPELLAPAIEEVLRFRSPLQWMYRLTTREATLHNQTIPAGQLVLAMIGSANRDESVFPDPDRFDIARSPNPHLAFGLGQHFCLGASLARLEARIALGDLLHGLRTFELASDEPWEPRKGLHVHGPSRLPIRFTPAEAHPPRLPSAPVPL